MSSTIKNVIIGAAAVSVAAAWYVADQRKGRYVEAFHQACLSTSKGNKTFCGCARNVLKKDLEAIPFLTDDILAIHDRAARMAFKRCRPPVQVSPRPSASGGR